MVDVVGSFMKGFQAGQGVVDTINQRERRETLESRQDTLWEQSQEDRAQRLADAQTQRERQKVLQGRQDVQWEQGQEDRETRLSDAEAARTRQKTLQGREDVQWKQGQEEYNHQKALQRRQEADQMTADWLNGMAEQGQYIAPPPELEAFYDDNPHLDISNILTPESVIGRQQARQLMQEMAQGQPIDRRDPRLLNSINQLFPEIVNNPNLPQTHNGQQITGRKISSIDMAPDGSGFMITQQLTLADGSQVEAPVTRNRSGAPDDNVVVVPFQMAGERLASLDKLDLNLDDDTKQQLFRSRVMRGLAKQNINTKDKSGIQKQMLATLDDLNKQEQEAMSYAASPEERQQISAQYEQMRQRTRDTYSEFIGDTGQPADRTRTDSQQFKSAIKTFETAADQMGIKWTPEIKADVEELYREGADAETVLRLLQQKYGGTSDTPENAQRVLDSILGGDTGQAEAEPMPERRPGEFEPGPLYNVGSDVFKPNVRNEAQAQMTPYQARPTQPTTLQQAYGAR